MEEEEYENYEEGNSGGSAVNGYRIAIIVLVLLLGALAFQYWRQTNILRGSEAELIIERDSLQSEFGSLMTEFDQVKFDNDTLSQNVLAEKRRADSLMSRIQTERQWSYAKVKKYEKELGTLRTVMQGYVRQIDSLNNVNSKLSTENIAYRKQLTSEQLRASKAEEKSQELQSKIRSGAVVKARDISLLALNDRDREVSRASRATRMRADFVLSANSITVPGERKVYIRILDGKQALLTDASSVVFEQDGLKIDATAEREIDYQGDDLSVSVYYKGEIQPSTYNVEIYMDGYLIGTNEIILK